MKCNTSRLKLFSTLVFNKCSSGMKHKGSEKPAYLLKVEQMCGKDVCETRWKQQTAATATFQLFLTGFTDVLLTTNCSAWWKCLPPATFLSTFNSTVLVYIATWHNKNVPVEFWILALLNCWILSTVELQQHLPNKVDRWICFKFACAWKIEMGRIQDI